MPVSTEAIRRNRRQRFLARVFFWVQLACLLLMLVSCVASGDGRVPGALSALCIPVAIGCGLIGVTISHRQHAGWLRACRDAGLCPHCSYNRAGLTPDAPCPECGRPPTLPPSNVIGSDD